MGRPFRLHVRATKDGPLEPVVGEFADEEWEIMKDYLRYTDELGTAQMVTGGHDVEGTIEWQQGAPVKFSWKMPPRPVVSEFLLLLRPLILQAEPTHFLRVRNILGRRLQHPVARRLLSYYAYLYSDRSMLEELIVRSPTGQVLNTDETLEKWLNAEAFHRDPRKRQELADMKLILPVPQQQVFFLSLLLDRARAILELGRFVRVLVSGGEGEFQCEVADA